MGNLKCFAIFVLALALAANFWASNQTFTFVREYNGSGGMGDLNFSLRSPVSIAISAGGDLYVADDDNGGAYELNASDAVVKNIGGIGSNFFISAPKAVFVDEGRVYIAEKENLRVLYYDQGSVITDVFFPKNLISNPSALWVENKTIWLVDSDVNSVFEYDTGRDKLAIYLSQGIGSGKIMDPSDIFIGKDNIYIADTSNNRVEVLLRNFSYADSIGTGSGGQTLLGPKGVYSDGARIYVADTLNNRIAVFDKDGYALGTLGGEKGRGDYQFDMPVKVKVFGDRLFVLDKGNKRVVEYSLNWSAGSEETLILLQKANQTISQYSDNVLAVLERLGMNRPEFLAPQKIMQASEYAGQGEYAKAQKSIDDALSELNASRAGEEGTLKEVLFAKIKDGKDEVSSLQKKEGLDGAQAKELADIFSELQNAFRQNDAGNYSASLAMIEDAKNRTTIFASPPKKQQAGQGAGASAPQVQPSEDNSALEKAVGARLLEAKNRLDKIENESMALNQSGNYDIVSALLDSGSALLKGGMYSEANASIETANAQMGSLELELNGRAGEIAKAQEAVGRAYAFANASGMLGTGANESAIGKKLADAQALVYENPLKAEQLANETIGDMRAALQENAKVSSAATATIGMIFLIILIGAVIFFLIRNRSKIGRLVDEIEHRGGRKKEKRKVS